MDVQRILRKALNAEKTGCIFEAQNYYQDGIEILMNMLRDEADSNKKRDIKGIIEEYFIKAERIQKRIEQCTTAGYLVSRTVIEEDSTGHGYNTLFGKYMNRDVKEIVIEEPYLLKNFQFQNLIVFFELAIRECTELKYVRLTTKDDKKNPTAQSSNLKQIKDDLVRRGITMSIIFDSKIHDRRIILGNGYIIKSGLGLNIFKPTNPMYNLGLCDYNYRKCRQTDVEILQTNAFK